MRNYIQQLVVLAKRLLILYLVYFLLRLTFLAFNYAYFSFNSVPQLILAFFLGIRFDTAAIVVSNSLFILLSILPFSFFYRSWYQWFLKILYLVPNAFFILMNCVDFSFFPFIQKRLAADIFDLFSLGSDMDNTLPSLFADFWFLLAIWVIALFLANLMYNRFTRVHPPPRPANRSPGWIPMLGRAAGKVLIMMLVIGFSIVASRGGVQLKPLGIISASEHTSPGNAPLVLNTTFSIIQSFGKQQLVETQYLKNGRATELFNPVHAFDPPGPFLPYNVVVIIMESFSREYCGFMNGATSYTPFLDSLSRESLVCRNAFANTRISIEGVPASIASMPALMEEPFITSLYSGNRINSLATALKPEGYRTAFFHGGNNGTMGFDRFARAAGFDRYFGRREYGNHDYDGHWGVYDHRFFRYFISEMDKMQEPFLSVFMSLSSHHPYSVPDYFKNQFAEGTLPIHKSVRYADFSLRQFFANAKRQDWFDNTLFVITADHSGPNALPRYLTKKGIYEIPILYYISGSRLSGSVTTTTQQADIMPTVLGLLHYSKPFFSFGTNLFDPDAHHFAVQYFDETYQLINDSLVIQFNGENVTAVYDHRNDPMLHKNLGTRSPGLNQPLEVLQSYIQQFNYRMLHNQLTR